ncbi:MAG: branched-chain amino acid ABC transporter permease [Burkholderiales bacterium]|nr:branched-chain amino acid ABC transporter permease [Burkholderiales bacterium]
MELFLQVVVNGLMLGGIYACIAVGFSLVWGVLNVINMLHGTLVILAGYLTYALWQKTGIHPLVALPAIAALMFAFGYALQAGAINRVIAQPVLVTMTLTFGLDMILYNLLNFAFDATPRRITLDFGRVALGELILPGDRLVAVVLAFLLTGLLYLLLRVSRIGRAIVAVRMDREAATLLGIDIHRVYAITFGIGAAMAGACGVLFALTFPVTTSATGLILGKAFVVCVIGGLGTVGGALLGGLILGLVESLATQLIGPQDAVTIGFVLMLVLLMTRPAGLFGRAGYE